MIAPRKLKIFAISFLLSLPINIVRAGEPAAYEMPRTQVLAIEDAANDRQYELYIKLPDGYSESTDKQYPVVYTTDAKWHLDMLSGATEYLMSDSILVGISWQTNLGADEEHHSRFRDYTTFQVDNQELQSQYNFGQANKHLAFIRDDVIPLVASKFRAEPNERTYFGYSLGGAFGAYVLFAEPDLFQNYILGSPAFSAKSATQIDQAEAQLAPQQLADVNVFVSIGELEESEMEITEEFVSVLNRRNGNGLVVTGLEIIEDSDHGTAFPATTLRGIKWLAQARSYESSGH
ncbi:alpha/beta hydrolase [Erythrobacter mangrovi]|uniref:Alpha/beta hydrolase n=1 Tax=Erythrobacter mangrovi TaxID=2739433 RepID=A0A7D4BML9_9SPHN|nr:alpha/beta hydrolase-fold protein [Erythrobacter mangrovi]QKG70344.1 alpha/beta hydrolase [Erythrobacter mangrovi]